MDRAEQLRDNAARYMRLARWIGNIEDIAKFEALAVEANHAAEEMEKAEAAKLAARKAHQG